MVKGCALRGRGGGWKHNFEIRDDLIANGLTHATKDSMMLIINDRGFVNTEPQMCEDVRPTLRAQDHGNPPKVVESKGMHRIRKISPLECFRLQNWSDQDFLACKLGGQEKAKEVVENWDGELGIEFFEHCEKIKAQSNTRLYSRAGNGVSTNILMAVLSQLNIDGVKPWNDLTEDARYELIAHPYLATRYVG